MTIGFVFWLLMILWLVFGCWTYRATPAPTVWGGSAFIFVLLFLIGWQVFGWPIKG